MKGVFIIKQIVLELPKYKDSVEKIRREYKDDEIIAVVCPALDRPDMEEINSCKDIFPHLYCIPITGGMAYLYSQIRYEGVPLTGEEIVFLEDGVKRSVINSIAKHFNAEVYHE